jgi:hypothetical protein
VVAEIIPSAVDVLALVDRVPFVGSFPKRLTVERSATRLLYAKRDERSNLLERLSGQFCLPTTRSESPDDRSSRNCPQADATRVCSVEAATS